LTCSRFTAIIGYADVAYFHIPTPISDRARSIVPLYQRAKFQCCKIIDQFEILTKLESYFSIRNTMVYSYFILKDTPILLLVLLLAVQVATVDASYKDGMSLAEAVYDRDSPKDSSAKVEMLLSKNGSLKKRRLLFSYGLDKGASERLTLMRFVQPKSVDGTGLLSKDYLGDDNDQWLYLPSLDRVRRISSKRKGGRFVGSEFFYEDLRDREVNMDDHILLGDGNSGKVSCLLLQSTPVKKSNSIYSKRVSCIHPKILIPLWTEFYKKKASPIKRLKAKRIKKVQGYWTIYESTMTNLKTGSATQLITREILYNQKIPETLFTQRGLEEESQELPYRPRALSEASEKK